MTERPSTYFPSSTHTSRSQQIADMGSINDFRMNQRMVVLRSIIHFLCKVQPNLAIKILLYLFLRPRRRPITYIDQLPEDAQPIKIFHKLTALRGYTWGRGKKSILLVHGWESHLGHMTPLILPLLHAGFRVVAFDGPGHGQSPLLHSDIIDFGEAVQEVIEQHGPFYGIIGNSFGATATGLMLNRYPDVQVKRFVMLSPMIHILQHIDIFDQLVQVPKEIMPLLQSNIESRIGMPIQDCNLLMAINWLAMPIYLVHDLDDQVIPVVGSQKLAEQGHHIEFLQTMGLGHRKVIHSPMVAKRIIEFLTDPNPSPAREEMTHFRFC